MNGMNTVAICFAAFFLFWIFAARKSKRTERRESLESRLSYTLLTAATFFLLFSQYGNSGILAMQWLPATPLVEFAGIATVAVGLGFAVWARLHLGQNWSATVTVKERHQLIRTGPYKLVRHPIYSGMIAAMAGAAVVNRELRGVVSVVLLFLGFFIKSRIEDRFMEDTFGAEYEAYRKITGALVPRLHN